MISQNVTMTSRHLVVLTAMPRLFRTYWNVASRDQQAMHLHRRPTAPSQACRFNAQTNRPSTDG
jgi:hypothetical protein